MDAPAPIDPENAELHPEAGAFAPRQRVLRHVFNQNSAAPQLGHALRCAQLLLARRDIGGGGVVWGDRTCAASKSASATLRALGLRGIGQTNTLPDRPEIRGMIARVPHLIEVTEGK